MNTISIRALELPASTSALSCRLVDTLAGLEPLRPHWDRLLLASPDHTPWQSFDYLFSWWRELSETLKLRVFVVERDGEPCLIAPLQISQRRWLKAFKLRRLEPIGMLMDVNRPRLALGPFQPDAYAVLIDAIWGIRQEWDAIHLDEKPWDDPEISQLRLAAVRLNCVHRHGFSHLIPFVRFGKEWEASEATRSRGFRKNLRTARRRLEARGKAGLRDLRQPAEIEEGLEIVWALHARSWKRGAGIEHSKSDGYRRFFAAWARQRAAFGGIRIIVLTCDAAPVAALISILDGATYYGAQIVHDERFDSCSPGTLLESMEFDRLAASGECRTFDLLGSFLNNKLRWTDTAHPVTHFYLIRRTFGGFLADAYTFLLKPYVRPWLLRRFGGGHRGSGG